MEDRLYWLWLTNLSNMNSYKITNLLSVFENSKEIYDAKESDYAGVYGLSQADINSLSDKSMDTAQTIINRLKIVNANVLTYDDIHYPDMLRQIENPPYVLYIKGEIMQWDRLLSISVVGTRNYNEYGLKVTKMICSDLARAGVTIVSGMARGLDSAAAVSALRAGNKTIAVLGCGIDIVYPAENGKLMNAIIQNGAVITEYPPGTPPLGRHFPERNRIMSGLSRGTLVVQAPPKSGALITAAYSLNNGKDVFAVPGDINNYMSKGCNELIKAGAKLTDSANDILVEYIYETELLKLPVDNIKKSEDIPYAKAKANNMITEKPVEQVIKKPVVNNVKMITMEDRRYQSLDDNEKKIISMLIEKNMHIDDIVRQSELPMQVVNSTLTILEMKTLIAQLPGKNFRLNI